jgi:hypothetical protein
MPHVKRGLIFDLAENIVRKPTGDWCSELTQIANEPSEERFEVRLLFLRASRAISGTSNASLDWQSRRFGNRLYFRLFKVVLRLNLLLFRLLFLCKRILCDC